MMPSGKFIIDGAAKKSFIAMRHTGCNRLAIKTIIHSVTEPDTGTWRAMIHLLSIFTTSFILAFSGAIMPGPLLTITIAETAKRGWIAGPLLILGHAVLELGMVLLLIFGAGPLLQSDIAIIAIAALGAAGMLWMALGMFRGLPTLQAPHRISGEEPASIRNGNHPLVSGILMSLANPYWTIWWAAIGLGYIGFALQKGMIGVLFFFLGHISGDFVWYSLISFCFSKGRHYITVRAYKAIIGCCAALLAGFGAWFGYMAIGKII